jgi:hypothetical protein
MLNVAALREFLQPLEMEQRIVFLLGVAGVYERVPFGEVRVKIGDACAQHVYIETDRRLTKADFDKLQALLAR